jgi:hypothetical protein
VSSELEFGAAEALWRRVGAVARAAASSGWAPRPLQVAPVAPGGPGCYDCPMRDFLLCHTRPAPARVSARAALLGALVVTALVVTALLVPALASAQGVRLFRDGTGGSYWDFSYAFQSGGSSVEMISGSKAPLDYTTKWRGTTAIRMRFTQAAGGDWLLGVANVGWVAVDGTQLDSLVFWAYSATALSANDLPVVFIEDKNNTRTPRYSMAAYNPGGLPAGQWSRLVMPLAPFKSGPGSANMSVINKTFFAQSPAGAMGVLRTTYFDEVRWVKSDPTPPVTPPGLRAIAGERHIDLGWDLPVPSDVESYRIERMQGGAWSPWTWASAEAGGAALWLGTPAVVCSLRAVTEDWSFRESAPSAMFVATTAAMDDEAFLEMIQRSTFRFFWDSAHPVSGLTRERSSSGNTCASGGTGFGIMAIPVGIEHGFITRAQGVARTLQILSFLANTCEKHFGAFPHWIDGVSGQHIGFLGATDDGMDLVETSYLAEGLLTARQYFDGAGADEAQIRAYATQLWEGIQWDAFLPAGSSTLRWHRSPTTGLSTANVAGWNECMITYLLAIASPTHPIAPSCYHAGWARGGAMSLNQSYYGHLLNVGWAYGGPMFFAHYSFVGFDPRYKRDAYANYYQHNRNHALVQVDYSAANPLGRTGYSAVSWGLTASDDPYGYSAHEPVSNDNGTLTPTAAVASIPYTPQQSLQAARHFYQTYGSNLWGYEGYRDAFHPGLGWTASDYIAIDQGPIVLMIENYRSQLLWNRFMSNPEIAPMLAAIGFVADSSSTAGTPLAVGAPSTLRLVASPNPAAGAMMFALELPRAADTRVEVFDLAGRRVAELRRGPLAAGRHTLAWNGRDERGALVPAGVYLARAASGETPVVTRFVRVR